jgi:hypothetical protein
MVFQVVFAYRFVPMRRAVHAAACVVPSGTLKEAKDNLFRSYSRLKLSYFCSLHEINEIHDGFLKVRRVDVRGVILGMAGLPRRESGGFHVAGLRVSSRWIPQGGAVEGSPVPRTAKPVIQRVGESIFGKRRDNAPCGLYETQFFVNIPYKADPLYHCLDVFFKPYLFQHQLLVKLFCLFQHL